MKTCGLIIMDDTGGSLSVPGTWDSNWTYVSSIDQSFYQLSVHDFAVVNHNWVPE
jgi:hypothetical protein